MILSGATFGEKLSNARQEIDRDFRAWRSRTIP